MQSPALGLYRGLGITSCVLFGYLVVIQQSLSSVHYSAGSFDEHAFFSFIDQHIEITCEETDDAEPMLFCTQGVGTNCPKGRPPLQKLSSKGSENPVYAGPYESGPMVVIDGITYLDDVSWKDNSNCKGIKIMKEKMGVDENIYKQRTPEEEQALSDKNIAGMKKEQEEREAIQKRVADNKAAKKASTSATTAQVSNTPSSRSTNTLAPKTTADLISAYEQKKGILLTTDQMNELQAMYTVSEKISAKESTPPSSSTAQKTEPAASPFAEGSATTRTLRK